MKTLLRLNGKHSAQHPCDLRLDARKAQGIVTDTLKGVIGLFAREHIICRGTKRIDICPRALVSLFLILLDGRKAGLYDHGKALALLRHILSCRAEVDELDVAIAANEDIIG